jgi:uncharacterized protein
MRIRFNKRQTYQVAIDGEKTVLSAKCRPASDFFSRLKGLMFREKLDDDEGLLIVPCNSIHTFFMRFPIDLVFVNRDWSVVNEQRNIQPGKVVNPGNGAWAVLELKGGRIDLIGLSDSITGKKLKVELVSE